jgi:hypothetical protein
VRDNMIYWKRKREKYYDLLKERERDK